MLSMHLSPVARTVGSILAASFGVARSAGNAITALGDLAGRCGFRKQTLACSDPHGSTPASNHRPVRAKLVSGRWEFRPFPLPEQLESIVRHTVQVPRCFGMLDRTATGTLVRLANGRLAIATATHVLVRYSATIPPYANPIPLSYTIRIGPEDYLVRVLHFGVDDTAPEKDLTLLLFSDADAARLRAKGLHGVSVAPRRNSLGTNGRPVISLGYPWAANGLLVVSEGQLLKAPSPDEEKIDASVYATNGSSGGGLFRWNPMRGEFEIVGVCSCVSAGQHTGSSTVSFARLDGVRVERLLTSWAAVWSRIKGTAKNS